MTTAEWARKELAEIRPCTHYKTCPTCLETDRLARLIWEDTPITHEARVAAELEMVRIEAIAIVRAGMHDALRFIGERV